MDEKRETANGQGFVTGFGGPRAPGPRLAPIRLKVPAADQPAVTIKTQTPNYMKSNKMTRYVSMAAMAMALMAATGARAQAKQNNAQFKSKD
jgi:hypothetical protein